MACSLIINADDFGWSEGTNAAITALHDEGIVTSCSLMLGGRAAGEAVAMARERPRLAVGLHLTLVHGYPLLSRERIPALVDPDGRLSRSYAWAGALYALPPWRPQWQAEAEAQFEAFSETGLPWSHVDSHVHFSLTPVVFKHAVRLARQNGVPGFRIPQDDFALYSRFDPLDARRQRWFARWFDIQCARQRRRLAGSGFVVPERCYGLFRSERLDEDYLVRLIEALPEGEFELHCHPTHDTAGGRTELDALRSPAFRQALVRRGVLLETYVSLGRKTQMGVPACSR